MASVAPVAEVLQEVVGAVPEAVARETGFCVRRSKLSAARFVQTLVLGWWPHPEASLSQLCQTAARLGTVMSPQGLDQRLGRAVAAVLAERLAAAVAHVLAAEPSARALLATFPSLLVLDSTTITLPDTLTPPQPAAAATTTHRNAPLHRKVDRRTDGQTDKRTDGQTDRELWGQTSVSALRSAPVSSNQQAAPAREE
jgi:hypothetical protein